MTVDHAAGTPLLCGYDVIWMESSGQDRSLIRCNPCSQTPFVHAPVRSSHICLVVLAEKLTLIWINHVICTAETELPICTNAVRSANGARRVRFIGILDAPMMRSKMHALNACTQKRVKELNVQDMTKSECRTHWQLSRDLRGENNNSRRVQQQLRERHCICCGGESETVELYHIIEAVEPSSYISCSMDMF